MKDGDQKSLATLYQHIIESSNLDHSILKLTFTKLDPKDKELLISYVEALNDPSLDEINILSEDSLEYFQYNVSYIGIKREIDSKKSVPFYVTQMYRMMKQLLSKSERTLTAIFNRIFKNCDVKLYKNRYEMEAENLTKKLPELKGIF
jgi:hypothetical protein